MKYFLKIFSLLLFFQLNSSATCLADAVQNSNDWQRVYLATFPRSGNHWIRYLIEEATHVATASVYHDRTPKHLDTPFPWGFSPENGCDGNCRYPTTQDIVVIKTHYPAKPKTKFDLLPALKIIRIVRYPLDSIHSHFVMARRKFPEDGKIPSEYARNEALKWKKFEEYWNGKDNVITIRYEDLFEKPHATLRKVLHEIGYQDVSTEDIDRAVEMHAPVGGVYKHAADYHPEDLKFISAELGPLVKKYGYKF